MSEVKLQRPTPAELEELKRDWAQDPCWDIEETEGFEVFREELLTYRKEKEAEWNRAYQRRCLRRADAADCPGNLALGEQLLKLEQVCAHHKARAQQVLERYLTNAGIRPDGDMSGEVESIVDQLIEAASARAKADMLVEIARATG